MIKPKQTYLNVGVGARQLLLIKLLSCLLIGRVLKIRSEESKMLLLLCSVLCLGRVKFCIFLLNSLLNQTGVANSDIMVSTARDLLTEILQPLSRSSQLTHLLNFESFCLLAHILEEDCQVGRDSVRTLQVLNIVTCIEFLTKILAHGLDVDYSIRELNIWLACVLETDRAQDLKLLILSSGIFLFFLLFDIN